MILPLLGHHIADIGNNRYSYPSTVVTYPLKRRNDLSFYSAGYLGPDTVTRCHENSLLLKDRKPEPARPLFCWKNTYTFEGISNDNQAD